MRYLTSNEISRFARYEIILTDYEIFFFEKCEIKFTFTYAVRYISHCGAIFIREAYFTCQRQISLKKRLVETSLFSTKAISSTIVDLFRRKVYLHHTAIFCTFHKSVGLNSVIEQIPVCLGGINAKLFNR